MPTLGSCRVFTSTPSAKQSGHWIPVLPTRHDLDMPSFSFSTQLSPFGHFFWSSENYNILNLGHLFDSMDFGQS